MKKVLIFTLTIVTLVTVFTACKPTLASCITKENDKYILTLPVSGKKIQLREEQTKFVSYISDSLVESAENKISQEISKYNESSGFYLQIHEDYLCLTVEVIKQLDEPDESVGCMTHEHLFFRERITTKAISTEEDDTNKATNNETSVTLLRYTWDGWGISSKTITGSGVASDIVFALKTLNETGETIAKVSDEKLVVGSGQYSVERGTMWVEAEGQIYRLTPDLSQICTVETHFEEGRVLEISDELKKLLNDAWSYAPYDYYKGTYHRGDKNITLTNVFSSDSSVELNIKNIYVDNNYNPQNSITVELLSEICQTVNISLRSQQSADNLALGDYKTVELKAGVPTTVDMKFGGWSEYNYWVYIEIDNTKVEIMIDPT